MASKRPMLTLTIDKSSNHVVFAEADKDFVDILLSFLTLPLGTILSLTNNNSTPYPCLNNIYKSVKDLNDEYFKINPGKELLLKPSYEAEMECLDLAVNVEGDRALIYYTCNQDCGDGIWSPYLNTKCNCGSVMNRKVKIVREAGKEGVFLKGVMRFIVTDDFLITPASTQAAMKLISGLCVRNLEERNVTVGRSEVLALMQSSLASNHALTDTFIAREAEDTSVALRRKIDRLTLNPNAISSEPENNKDNIRIKLIIDKHENKVLYAESNQDFVNLLFGILTCPSGAVIKIFNQNSRITCFDNLYASVLKPDIADSFKISKEFLLNPKIPPLLLHKNFIKLEEITEQKRYYMCRTPECDSNEVSSIANAPCKCNRITNKRMKMFNPYVNNLYSNEGFVKEAAYIITDDLIITPLRSLSYVTRLIANTKEGIKELIINIGEKEMLLLLEAALRCETALTDAFMKDIENK